MSTLLALALALTVAPGPTPAATRAAAATMTAPRWPVEPVLGLSFSLAHQVLTVRGATPESSLSAPSAVGALTVAVRYPLARERVWLYSALALGASSLDAHALLGVEQQALASTELTPWLGLRAGLGLAATLDVHAAWRSSARVSLALAVRLWRCDLVWTPALALPLGDDTRTVGPTQRVQQMALELQPLSFALRFSLGSRP